MRWNVCEKENVSMPERANHDGRSHTKQEICDSKLVRNAKKLSNTNKIKNFSN